MPRFDGTGPRGQGAMTGRGEGYCALTIPELGNAPSGYAGLQGTPVSGPALGARFARRLPSAPWPRRALGRRPPWRAQCRHPRARGTGP